MLVGIMIEFDDCEIVLGWFVVVILNIGIIYCVGYNWMFVMFVCDMVVVGIVVLCFDLLGLGDSVNCYGVCVLLFVNMEDICEVVDWLVVGCGYLGVILMGLCLGVD